MKFYKIPRRKIKTVIKGIISSSIPYIIRVPNNDWSKYMPIYENQKWGNYDSDDCWCLSSIQNFTFQMNYLLKNNLFSIEALNFFNSNGYIINGIFQFSELYHEILCGNLNNGGTSEEAWQSFASRGMIPRSMLNYSEAMASDDTNIQVFITEYYDKSRITPAMKSLANQFLQYVNIQSIPINPNLSNINYYLQQSPINIGIPVNPYQWNQVNVPTNTSSNICHEVVYYKSMPDNSLPINDQYQPNPKILGAGYYIGVATLGVVTPIQYLVTYNPPSATLNMSQYFANLVAWIQGETLPYPDTPIGSII
jgi:hypothetical protein